MLLPLVLLLPSLCLTVNAASASLPLHRRGRALSERDGGPASAAFLQAELARTRQKYGLGTAQDRRRAVASVPLTEESGDASFFASMTVGGSSFEIVLDTGSADLVVAASGCSSCGSTTPLYTPSSSASVTTQQFEITYGTGSASGILVNDTVSLAGFTVESQTVAACTSFDNLLSGEESGLLGLGWQSLATSHAVPFIQRLWQQGDLTNPLFGLGYDNSGGGTLTLGDVDSAAISGDINYVDLVDSGSYWQVPLEDVLINGVSVGVSASSAIIDSGTSLVSMPASAVKAVYAAISPESVQSGQLMLYPCKTSVTLSLKFGGIVYDVPSDAFSYGPVDDYNNQCYGSVYDASQGSSDSTFIVGASFLQHVYSSYRFSPPAVGFGKLAGSASAAASPASSPSASSSSSVAAPIDGSSSTAAAAPSSMVPDGILPIAMNTQASSVESSAAPSDSTASPSSTLDIASPVASTASTPSGFVILTTASAVTSTSVAIITGSAQADSAIATPSSASTISRTSGGQSLVVQAATGLISLGVALVLFL